MTRPCCVRRIGFVPGVTYFKPAGIPLKDLEEINVTLDELEALRLADLNGLYQEQAAEQMKISRPTFSRVIESARKKVADALIRGRALRLEGGPVVIQNERKKKMKVCIPVENDRGLESQVYGHFGSAPLFVLADTETMRVEPLANSDRGHIHGQCSPVKALAGLKPDAVLVGGIGPGALHGLRSLGIRVFRCDDVTVAEALRRLNAGELQEMDEVATCAGHSHGCH